MKNDSEQNHEANGAGDVGQWMMGHRRGINSAERKTEVLGRREREEDRQMDRGRREGTDK